MIDVIARCFVLLLGLFFVASLVFTCTGCVLPQKQEPLGFDSHVASCAKACRTGSIIQFGSCKCVLYGVEGGK